MKVFSIGCDVGGSHISSAAVDMGAGKIIQGTHSQKKIDSQGAASEIISNWIHCIKITLEKVGAGDCRGIGFAMPGPFDYAKGIAMFERVPKYQGLYGLDIGAAIREGLSPGEGMVSGDFLPPGERVAAAGRRFSGESNSNSKYLPKGIEIPVRFMNDATAFAVAEAWIGKTAKYRRSLAITLGTGFGSAFIDGGIPVLEGDRVPNSGCLWHLPFKEGMADDYFSTRWFEQVYLKKTGKEIRGAKAVADLAHANDPDAIRIFEVFGCNLAECLGPWIRKFGCEAIVAGGNITEAGSLWENAMKESLKHQEVEVPLLFSELKEDAAIIGSARLMEHGFWKKAQTLLPLM